MSTIIRVPTPTWLVGCGNMAGAMVEGWRSAGVDLTGAVAIRPSGRPVEGVRTVSSIEQAGPPPQLAILGFKPQNLEEVAPVLARRLSAQTVIVSLLAGVEAGTLRDRFRGAGLIVRATPNLPVAIRRGVVALYSEDASDTGRDQLSPLFSVLGYAVWVSKEDKLSAIGSVAGAGPAYVARFVEALAKAGEKRGLDATTARTIALETVLGTSWMAATTGESMGEVARRVASPNGTTEAGLAVLDKEDALDNLVALTVEAAARRGVELAEEARIAKVD